MPPITAKTKSIIRIEPRFGIRWRIMMVNDGTPMHLQPWRTLSRKDRAIRIVRARPIQIKRSQTKDKHEPSRLTACCTNNHSNQQEVRMTMHGQEATGQSFWNATDIGNSSTDNCRNDSGQDCVEAIPRSKNDQDHGQRKHTGFRYQHHQYSNQCFALGAMLIV